MKFLNTYRDSMIINNRLTCKHIIVGDYSYYAGYYDNHNFEDCVMYLDALDNLQTPNSLDRLIIGKFCSIATGARFMMGGTQGHHYQWIANYPLDAFDDDFDGYTSIPPKAHQNKGDTIIGNDVWIGAEALIMGGVQIADGAIIGARALVTKNVGPFEIWGGNPAKLIKKRFSEKEIEKLLQIKWWDWDLTVLKRNLTLLRSQDVNELFTKFQSKTL